MEFNIHVISVAQHTVVFKLHSIPLWWLCLRMSLECDFALDPQAQLAAALGTGPVGGGGSA